MKLADRIRKYSTEKYVSPARQRKVKRFSIRAGDVVHEMRIGGDHAAAVCGALKTRDFLRSNSLQLIARTGPKSGQSTTVTYTYEFIAAEAGAPKSDAWLGLRGVLKHIFSELGGGEAYLRNERDNFYTADSSASPESK